MVYVQKDDSMYYNIYGPNFSALMHYSEIITGHFEKFR